MLSPETVEETEPLAPSPIEDLLPLFVEDKNVFLENVKVTKEQQKWVAEKTKEQRKSHYWGMY